MDLGLDCYTLAWVLSSGFLVCFFVVFFGGAVGWFSVSDLLAMLYTIATQFWPWLFLTYVNPCKATWSSLVLPLMNSNQRWGKRPLPISGHAGSPGDWSSTGLLTHRIFSALFTLLLNSFMQLLETNKKTKESLILRIQVIVYQVSKWTQLIQLRLNSHTHTHTRPPPKKSQKLISPSTNTLSACCTLDAGDTVVDKLDMTFLIISHN